MNKIEHYGKVEDGRLIVQHKKALLEKLKSIEGKWVTITIERIRSIRSGQQNRYYWGVVIPSIKTALKDAGYSTSELQISEIHEFLKRKFLLTTVVNKETGEMLDFTRSTTQLSVSEFNDYIAECVQFAAEFLSYTIPDPDPNFLTKI